MGLETLAGSVIDTPQIALTNSNSIEISNCIVDDLHVRNIVQDIVDQSNYDNATVLHALFNGDMEAGNISMRENTIEKLRLKRKEGEEEYYSTVAEFDFDNQIITETYFHEDYEAVGKVDLNYTVCPVDSSGIEGMGTSVSTILNFEGWWIIDLDKPEENNFQFIYNLDSVDISTEQDRTVLSTFSKYPYVRYGAKHCKQGTLKSMVIDTGTPVWKQAKKLDSLAQMHKSFLLKDGNGHKYIVDIHSPTESTYEAIKDAENVTIEWYQVDEVNK